MRARGSKAREQPVFLSLYGGCGRVAEEGAKLGVNGYVLDKKDGDFNDVTVVANFNEISLAIEKNQCRLWVWSWNVELGPALGAPLYGLGCLMPCAPVLTLGACLA